MRKSATFVSVLLSAVITARTDAGAETITKSISDVVYCSSSTQACNNPHYVVLRIKDKAKSVKLRFTVAGTACSSIRVTPYINGVSKGTSAFLGYPGGTGSLSTKSFSLGVLKRGKYLVSTFAEGQIGGCNSGYLGSWGGKFKFTATETDKRPNVIPDGADYGTNIKKLTF